MAEVYSGGKKSHKIFEINLVGKKFGNVDKAMIRRVHHFPHILVPPKNQKMWCGRCAPKFFFLIFWTPFSRFFQQNCIYIYTAICVRYDFPNENEELLSMNLIKSSQGQWNCRFWHESKKARAPYRAYLGLHINISSITTNLRSHLRPLRARAAHYSARD